MKRKGLTQLNISVTILHQVITSLCALILPRFILTAFGSETNGLLQSVSQILSYTTLMELGIGGVVLASLYKPLAMGDNERISGIFNETVRFFKRILVVFVLFSLALSLCAKFFIKTSFDYGYVFFIVLILALNVYFNYYFGLPHQLLLKADRRLYVVQSVQMITTVVNLLVCIWAIELGAGIHTVKLVSAAVFIANPVVYRLYVKKHYIIDTNIKSKSLNQKKEATVHHLAYFIHRNTDIVIISSFLSLASASVYSVYSAVIVAIENLLNAISSGVAGTIGNILAKGEEQNLEKSFGLHESVNTFLSTAVFSVAGIMILPFVKIYTSGVTDVEYIQPVFAVFILAAGFVYCLRIPYASLISTAGHYKETKTGAIGEVCINLTLSLLLVKPMGICGVALGTLCAMGFRTIYMVWYLSKNILHRPILKFVKSFGVNIAVGIVLICLFERFTEIDAESIWGLIPYGVGVSVVVFGVLAVINTIINFDFIRKVRR